MNSLLYIAYEDILSLAVIKKSFDFVGGIHVACEFTGGGIGYLKKNAKAFNDTSQGCPFLMLADLDKAECVPSVKEDWFPNGVHDSLIFCMAVREIEAWLLADRKGFSGWLQIRKASIPPLSEEIYDPKECLLGLVRSSRKTSLQRDILPPSGSSASIGRNYNAPLITFVQNTWDIEAAASNSASLRRMLTRLRRFKDELEME